MPEENFKYQCLTCKLGRGGSCWPEYPKATNCQDYKEDTNALDNMAYLEHYNDELISNES
jgi:hypothetical protein